MTELPSLSTTTSSPALRGGSAGRRAEEPPRAAAAHPGARRRRRRARRRSGRLRAAAADRCSRTSPPGAARPAAGRTAPSTTRRSPSTSPPTSCSRWRRARLALRGQHGVAADRGRIVREAIAVILADLGRARRRLGPRPAAARALTAALTPTLGVRERQHRRGSDRPTEADGAAPARFTVKLTNFEGPFDLLLQLIGKHKLDVTEIALSKVTDEFIAHLRALGSELDLDQASEFLVVASTLLDLKAARLLPAADVDDEDDLELLEARDLLFARLLQYKAYKQAAAFLREREAEAARRFPREAGAGAAVRRPGARGHPRPDPRAVRRAGRPGAGPEGARGRQRLAPARPGGQRRRAAARRPQSPGAVGDVVLPGADRRLRAHQRGGRPLPRAAGALPAAAGGVRAADAARGAARAVDRRACRRPTCRRRTAARTTPTEIWTRSTRDRAGPTGAGAHLLGRAGRRAGGHPRGGREPRRRRPGDLGRRRQGAGHPGGRAAGRGAAGAGSRSPGRGARAAGRRTRRPPTSRPGSRRPEEEPRSRWSCCRPRSSRGGLEALLFVMDDPVDEDTLAGALRCTVEQVRSRAGRPGRGLRRAPVRASRCARWGRGGGSTPARSTRAVVERYLVDGQRSRLTQAALETLAVIAYRQPVTRARVSGIRGVGVDGVMRTLLVARAGARGRAPTPTAGAGSTRRRRCSWSGSGLRSLADLPELAPLLPETSTMLDEHPDS